MILFMYVRVYAAVPMLRIHENVLVLSDDVEKHIGVA